MSKGNMLLGHARGKVGDIVFSRANGEQVTRARAAVVKNPQTTAQMVQRVIALTIAQAYSQMAAICDHSFQGVAAGMSSMNFFRSRNMKMLRAKLAESGGDFEGAYNYTPLGTNIFVVNPYEVSTGRLPRITPNVGNGGIILEGAGTTYQNLVDKYGLQRGDQLTFVAIAGDSVDSQAFHFVRVILSPTNADGTKAEMSVPFINGTSVNLPNERNEGDFFTFEQSGNDVTLNCAGGNLRAAAVIVSRQVNGTWERSNATMIVADGEGMDCSMADALQGSASLSFASDRYLNNANTAGGTGTSVVSAITIAGQNAMRGNTVEVTAASPAVIVSPTNVPSGAVLLKIGVENSDLWVRMQLTGAPLLSATMNDFSSSADNGTYTLYAQYLDGSQNPVGEKQTLGTCVVNISA